MLTPKEVFLALQDFGSRESIQMEVMTRSIWESTRVALLHHYAMHPVKPKPKRVQDVFKLPWDSEEPKKAEQNLEEMKQIMRAFKSSVNKGQNRKKRVRQEVKNKGT